MGGALLFPVEAEYLQPQVESNRMGIKYRYSTTEAIHCQVGFMESLDERIAFNGDKLPIRRSA